MRDRQVCIDCGTLSPETETNYTLISSQFGWRLSRTRAPDGTFNVEWRCPNCWKEYKRQKAAAEEAKSASVAPPPTSISNRPLPSFVSQPPSGPVTPRQPMTQPSTQPAGAPPPIPPRLPRRG
jgi:hypothetical protein